MSDLKFRVQKKYMGIKNQVNIMLEYGLSTLNKRNSERKKFTNDLTAKLILLGEEEADILLQIEELVEEN